MLSKKIAFQRKHLEKYGHPLLLSLETSLYEPVSTPFFKSARLLYSARVFSTLTILSILVVLVSLSGEEEYKDVRVDMLFADNAQKSVKR